jgi:hypothetical protein
LVGSLL